MATAELAWKVHPRGTDEMRVRDALGVLFWDEDFLSGEFEGMYSPLGQPGLSPALLLLVTILQFMHNLSDREAAQAVADRISWKYLLGLALDDVGFDASVLSEFRDRLAVGGRADRLLGVLLERLGGGRAGPCGWAAAHRCHPRARLCAPARTGSSRSGRACGRRWRRSPGSVRPGWCRCLRRVGMRATGARWRPPGC